MTASLPGSILRDKTTPGLQLRTFKDSMAYYFYYRTSEGTERRPKLGDARMLTLADARRMAKKMAGVVAGGGDPSRTAQAARSNPDMKDLCVQYLHRYGMLKKSADNDKRLINGSILLRMGWIPAIDIKHEHVDALHQSLAETPYQANRVLALLSKMFNLAELWELRPPNSNPCRHIKRFRELKRRRIATEDELKQILAGIRKYEDQLPNQALFLYLLIFTGARKSEIARAKSSQIQGNYLTDLDNKTGDDRPIYLPDMVINLIKKVPPGQTLTGIKDPKQLWNLVRTEAGCKDLRMHDIRRTFASVMISLGYSLDQIGELLRHRSTQTTSRYAWLTDSVRNEAAEETASKLMEMMS